MQSMHICMHSCRHSTIGHQEYKLTCLIWLQSFQLSCLALYMHALISYKYLHAKITISLFTILYYKVARRESYVKKKVK